ncbi:MAG: DUF2911 domain-containing protein [Gemmatimonadota bacterium]|nr:DUF2911 domain-containing protein [Gemmatimonadota bacterium]
MQTIIVSLAALAALRLAPAAVDGKSSWITTLGRDTVVVESAVRAGNRVTGDIVVRVPATVRLHYDVELRPDGSAVRSTVDTDPMGAKNIGARHIVIDFDADSAHASIDSAGTKRKIARAIPKGAIPTFMTGFGASYGLYSSMALYELTLQRTRPATNDTLSVPGVDIATGTLARRKFVARSATLVDVDYFGIMWTHLTVDASGNVTAADARATTEQTETQRTSWVDASEFAKRFAQADHSGKGVGLASPNQIEKGTISGETVIVVYGSPRRRGRTILGTVIPYDRVWRTGANEATTIVFDKDLVIGGTPVPAGAYSLWTIPKADGTVQLIVNTQHGQWGTEYDSAKDLVHIRMQASTAPSPQEDFAISITNAGNVGALRISWDAFVWSVPISVKQ